MDKYKYIILFSLMGLILLPLAIITLIDIFPGGRNYNFNLIKIRIAETTVIEDLEKKDDAMRLVDEIRSFDLNFVSNISPGFLWVVVTDTELDFLREKNYEIEFIERNAENELFKRMVWGVQKVLPQGYHTIEELTTELNEIHYKFPDITTLEVIGTTQHKSAEILALKISDNAGIFEDEPKVLYSAVIHGNEIMGTEVCLALIHELLEKYGTDKRITNYIDNLEIWFVPVINVDGYTFATTDHPMWRKNLRDNDGDGKWGPGDGVDLNRNFKFSFETSGSSDPSSRFYRGPSPFSEKESFALAEFVKRMKFLFSFTYHSAESRIYYPWRKTVNSGETFTPEDELLTGMAQKIAESITCINENYTYEAVRNTFKESYTTNYYYGVLGTIEFIIELGKYDHVYPEQVLKEIIGHNLPAAFYLLDRALGPGLTGVITDSSTGKPLKAVVRLVQFDSEIVQPRTTQAETGRFFRALLPGRYSIVVEADGMEPKHFEDFQVNERGWTTLNVVLQQSKSK